MNDTATVKRDIVLARMGEITLKGMNRGRFEHRLIDNISRRLKPLGAMEIYQTQSRIWIVPSSPDIPVEAILERVTGVFGVVSASPAWEFYGGMEELREMACRYMEELLGPGGSATFKVESRRGDKRFPLSSPEISAEIGGLLDDRFERLTVDVHHPDYTLNVEIREHGRILLYHRIVKGHRGLPVGTAGKAMLLLSGGIDSPVAGYMMASRGLELECVYFHSYPYTSERALDKVTELARILTSFCGRTTLHIVDFTDIQLVLRDSVPEDMLTVIMRRVMMRIAEELARLSGSLALVTGESLGQVASQTLEALVVTNEVVSMPVFRPLVGLDKDATVEIARRIGTFETSILPYEDCCTLFVAKHPKTKPTLEWTRTCEEALDIPDLVARGVAGVREVTL
ncbi:MAG: tRNA 4-thiouridine(8) synthase ThiI [Clostridia bacterium]|nr:tRNA 4-thiouridine(8) synthase ThiI [Clostridia bacterium]